MWNLNPSNILHYLLYVWFISKIHLFGITTLVYNVKCENVSITSYCRENNNVLINLE